MTTMRLTLMRSAILTAGLVLAAAPAVAHAQDSSGGGSLPAGSSGSFTGSAETVFEAYRFDRTYTREQITECREDSAGDIATGLPRCPTAPITALDLAAARLIVGSMQLVFGGSSV
ncbi:hypothetical protein EF834_04110 [Rhodococcus spongiicola]|uniref:Uncharacterized protein n=2 Tax=Rhodococcus spongiicola TaxID=2487352 RepID=A0A3S3E619_9NOCA|nr:hypothetical protein EF834_04110 [Rhodococcus spongiicola]